MEKQLYKVYFRNKYNEEDAYIVDIAEGVEICQAWVCSRKEKFTYTESNLSYYWDAHYNVKTFNNMIELLLVEELQPFFEAHKRRKEINKKVSACLED